jgi:hypothetical protein
VCTKASASAGKEERLSSDGLRKKVTKENKEEGERAGEAKHSEARWYASVDRNSLLNRCSEGLFKLG